MEARLARRRARYRVRRRRESRHTRETQLDANRAAQQLRREAETLEARQARLQHDRAAQRLRREAETHSTMLPPNRALAQLVARWHKQQLAYMTVCSLPAEGPNVRQAQLQQDRQTHLQQREVNPTVAEKDTTAAATCGSPTSRPCKMLPSSHIKYHALKNS